MRSPLEKKVTEFLSPVKTILYQDQQVAEALERIRTQPIQEKIFYFYITDREQRLRGVVSTRSLLLAAPDAIIHSLKEEHLISLSSDQTLREAMETLSSHRLLAIPVVDKEERLLGVIDIQHYMQEAIDLRKSQKGAIDLFQMLGITLEEEKTASVWRSYRNRMPWIFCNMIGGIACAIISRVFELVLSQVLLLAFFIPLVLTLSESIAMQSMSYSLQLLHRPSLSIQQILKRILSDWRIVSLLGLSSGVIVGCLSLLWGEGVHPAFAIAAGISLSTLLSGAVGAAVPLVLHTKKLDPKVAAGPVVLTFADVITTTLYLSIATFWLLPS